MHLQVSPCILYLLLLLPLFLLRDFDGVRCVVAAGDLEKGHVCGALREAVRYCGEILLPVKQYICVRGGEMPVLLTHSEYSGSVFITAHIYDLHNVLAAECRTVKTGGQMRFHADSVAQGGSLLFWWKIAF